MGKVGSYIIDLFQGGLCDYFASLSDGTIQKNNFKNECIRG